MSSTILISLDLDHHIVDRLIIWLLFNSWHCRNVNIDFLVCLITLYETIRNRRMSLHILRQIRFKICYKILIVWTSHHTILCLQTRPKMKPIFVSFFDILHRKLSLMNHDSSCLVLYFSYVYSFCFAQIKYFRSDKELLRIPRF